MKNRSASYSELGPDVKKAVLFVLKAIYSAWERQEQWESSDGLPPPKGVKTVDVPISPVHAWFRRNNYFDRELLESALWVLNRHGLLIPIGKDRHGYDSIFYTEGVLDGGGDIAKETHFVVKVPADFSKAYAQAGVAFSSLQSDKKNSPIKEQSLERLTDQSLSFDSSKGEILFKQKRCNIPVGSNQYQLCLKLFELPLGNKLKEDDVINDFYRGKKSPRSFYDAVRAINARAKNELGIPNLLVFKASEIWVRPESHG